ncbi:MAG: histidine kinase [Clostridia bacterium]|nr:histidine kinase [Clostridia bacterium]
MRHFKLIMLVFSAAILITACSTSNDSHYFKAEQGVLDLTGCDLKQNSTIKLDGEWEFYWNSFFSYSDFSKAKPDMYIGVPSTWNEYSINGESLPGEGYATYRLHVKTNFPSGTILGLRIYVFSSAYTLYINERTVASNGKPGKNVSEEVGKYKPQAVFFNIPSNEFDIIIHVSNHQYARGGFWYSMYIGGQEGILSLHDSIMGKEIFLLGALLIISLFYFAIFIMRRELKYCLYFACFCVTTIVALDMVGQYMLLKYLPDISLGTTIFLWYTSANWVLFFLMLYVNEIFKSRFSKIIVRTYLGIIIASQMLFTFTPSAYYTKFGRVSNITEILGVLFIVIIVAIGIRKEKKDGWLNIASMTVVFATYIHDILYWMNLITSSYGEAIYLGLFIFILIQMIIQAKRIRQFYDRKTVAELNFLHAQIKPHFLYNAINTFISISRYDIERARDLLINFSNYLRRSFDFKDLSKTTPLKNEVELAKAYVRIEKARFEEELEVNFGVCDDLEVKVPILILQPVIENAINHGILPKPEGGRVDVAIKTEGNSIKFSVKDNGVGMKIKKGVEPIKNEFGKGVGLSNINKRLKRLYGTGLIINSSPGSGTEVIWFIPIKK